MASTYLTRAETDPQSNQTTGTYSVWVKRGALGSYQTIFNHRYSGSYEFKFIFYNDDTMFITSNQNGVRLLLQTNRKFRDTNGWYHIVLAVDSTQGTSTDRAKLYINGVQETSFVSSGGNSAVYPSSSQGLGLDGGNGYTNYIGTRDGSSEIFDGCMSHFHHVDGTALAPTVFGSTDSTTGEWQINTSPSYTVGAKGFFILKDSNSVTDASTNTNNFTVAGGTLTKTEDNPSNVFATLNPLAILGTTNRNISYGNTKFYTGTNAWGTMLSTLAFPSGKFYAEFKVVALQASAGYGGLGITDSTENYQSDDTINNHSTTSAGVTLDHRSGVSKIKSAGSEVTSNIGNFSNGNIVGLAADMDNKALYIHLNGAYYQIGGVTGVPTSGASKTGALTIPATCTNCMFFVSSYTSDATFSSNFGNGYQETTAVSSAGVNASGNGIFEYDVPTGYTALSTKGLNL